MPNVEYEKQPEILCGVGPRASVLECGCPLPLWFFREPFELPRGLPYPKRQRTAALQDAGARSDVPFRFAMPRPPARSGFNRSTCAIILS